MNISNQTYYILLSGRWFTTKNLKENWSYIASEKLPEDFQTAEYLMDHGMVDAVVPRAEQPEYIGRLLDFMKGSKDSRKRA